ncbi:MAG: GTPase ObgE [Deltaproteobacteria bacterium]|nr:GTPase ObgE [Deltaproteobacteria bacterium]
MKFLDEAKIYVQAGHGGPGCVSFRREAHVPRGGPDGGNGGDGGSVIIMTDEGLNTLYELKGKRHFRAKSGGNGMGKGMQGRRGADAIIRVPPGTLIRDAESGHLLADLTENHQSFIVAKGGLGGRGNLSYASSTNRAPRKAQSGLPGEEKMIQLELKLLADVGLIGRPNAGKSTLISAISAARPKIADYPFTTIQPQLGVVKLNNYKTFTVADIPGLIEGAHQGTGMGIQFLKHIERTRIFLHLIDLLDPEEPDPFISFDKIEHELKSYSEEFEKRTRWVVFTKGDLLQDEAEKEKLREAREVFSKKAIPHWTISAHTRQGLTELIQALAKKLSEMES